MRAQEFINGLRQQGRYSFTLEEAKTTFQKSLVAVKSALHRLKKRGMIISPARGFYLVVPPEYQIIGCLPAEMFVDDLMKYLNKPYYVGFLSAAQYYGAAHQKPQVFQVVTSKNLRSIVCGSIYIKFVTNRLIKKLPVKLFNTASGIIKVATPELIIADMLANQRYALGIDNVATILLEIAKDIHSDNLKKLMSIYDEAFWLQRLGYLSDFLGLTDLSGTLEKLLSEKKLKWINLVPSHSYLALERNTKWKIIINTKIEPDEI